MMVSDEQIEIRFTSFYQNRMYVYMYAGRYI